MENNASMRRASRAFWPAKWGNHRLVIGT